MSVSQLVARSWIDRWDAQQQAYLPDREDRFTVLIDAVQECAGRPDPLVLDVGCGPGSLAIRIIDRIPAASVVAIDADPLLLELGRAAWADRDRSLRFADHDLRVPGWSAALGLDRLADAAVSTTALHWLPPAALAAAYAEVATILRPGGLLLNGDHLKEDEAVAPVLAGLGPALNERAGRRRALSEPEGRGGAWTDERRRSEEGRRHLKAPRRRAKQPALGGGGETWEGWWAAARADPVLAPLTAERMHRSLDSEHHGSPSGLLSVHVAALRAAGFAEVGTIWQHGDNRLLCGVR